MLKRKILNFMICCMLMVSAIFFSSCSNINVTTKINNDGTIDELVYVKVDDKDLISQGYTTENILTLKNDIQEIGTNVCENICDNFNLRVQTDILLSSSVQETAVLTSFVNGISIVRDNLNQDGFTFGIRFKNPDVYKYYYNITQTQSPTYKSEKHFLYTKFYYYGLTMYVDYTSLYNNIKTQLVENYPDIVANNTATLSYTYETDSRREHSDADFIYSQNGKYYHVWSVDANDFSKPVMIYYNIANSGNCILLCVGVTVMICGILIIIALIVDRKKLKRQTNLDK